MHVWGNLVSCKSLVLFKSHVCHISASFLAARLVLESETRLVNVFAFQHSSTTVVFEFLQENRFVKADIMSVCSWKLTSGPTTMTRSSLCKQSMPEKEHPDYERYVWELIVRTLNSQGLFADRVRQPMTGRLKKAQRSKPIDCVAYETILHIRLSSSCRILNPKSGQSTEKSDRMACS